MRALRSTVLGRGTGMRSHPSAELPLKAALTMHLCRQEFLISRPMAPTATQSMPVLPHDLSVCIWALQVDKSEGRLI